MFCGYAAALRGEELGHARLGETAKYTKEGLTHRRKPHVVLALQGRFKGVAGRRKHYVPLTPCTASGIQPKSWLLRLLWISELNDVRNGPLFRRNRTTKAPARIRDLDVWLHAALRQLQDQRPDLISPGVKVESYSFRRSGRRGATGQARVQKIPEDVIYLNNRWRRQDKAKGAVVSGPIMEVYTDVRVAVEALLRFSEAL